jgi:carboxypeptidase family protein/TonB-dependent receptor-like protein
MTLSMYIDWRGAWVGIGGSSHRERSRVWAFVTLALLGLMTPDSTGAQVIRGIVFDETGGAPIPGVTVTILTTDLKAVDSATTGTLGSFAITLAQGRYLISAGREGWISSPPEGLDLGEGGEVQVTLGLQAARPTVDVSRTPTSTGVSYVLGRIIDQETGAPISTATVVLADMGRTVTSGVDGRFRFGDAPPGAHSVRVEAMGYAPTQVPIETEAGIAHHVLIPLADQPIEVEGITVTTRSRLSARVLEPAYERMSRGLGGQFLGPEELERKGPQPIAEVLQGMLSVRVRGHRFHRTIQIRRCSPAVYLNGVRVARPGDDANEFLSISTREFEVVEVYGGAATLPPEFAPGAMCAVALWSRR